MRIAVYTWKDVIDHLIDYLGGNPSAEATRDAKRASLAMLREFPGRHNWSYYFCRHRISLVAPYSTGTIEYDHTGGAFERLVILSGGTWPTWAEQGTLLINNVPYEVASRKSATQLVLSTTSNPGVDVAADTSYLLYRDTYPLPYWFRSIAEIVVVDRSTVLQAETPAVWLSRQRTFRGTGTPVAYCVRGDPNYVGVLAISFFPPPDQALSVDLIASRRPRDLKIEEINQGTCSSVTGSATLVGSGTNWTSSLVGSVVRLSGTSSEPPTGYAGNNPPALERMIIEYIDDNTLLMDDISDVTLTDTKYNISDPIDVETGTMLEAFLRGCEFHIATFRRQEQRADAHAFYSQALVVAKEADMRNQEYDRLGGRVAWPTRLADMPLNWGT